MSLAEKTQAYQAYLETYRQHSNQFEDEELEMFEEDLKKAYDAMETAWLETIKTI